MEDDGVPATANNSPEETIPKIRAVEVSGIGVQTKDFNQVAGGLLYILEHMHHFYRFFLLHPPPILVHRI